MLDQAEKDAWWKDERIISQELPDDLAVFNCLTLDCDYIWFTAERIALATSMTTEAIESFLKKYLARGFIRLHPTSPGVFGEAATVAPWIRHVERKSVFHIAS
jgi:hypothetical protein